MFCFIVFIFLIKFSNSQYEGEVCTTHNNNTGVCVQLKNCQSIVKGIQRGKFPKTCSFVGDEPVVCCEDVAITGPLETSTLLRVIGTSVSPEESTTEKLRFPLEPTDQPSTTEKTPLKSWNKCVAYHEQVFQPKGSSGSIGSGIIYGLTTRYGEYPHMVLLGFESQPNDISFECGGTLISDKFVLTAGHCTYKKRSIPVKYALIDVVNKTNYAPDKLHNIINIIQHPDYHPPVVYNDIALLELEKRLTLTETIMPACLNYDDVTIDFGIAAGWGTTSNRGPTSDVLLKVILMKFDDAECTQAIGKSRHRPNGFDPHTQLCYGSKNSSGDTCKGDSGGPLHTTVSGYNKGTEYYIHIVIGITSFGGSICGVRNQPGVYTKLSNYVQWIEDIVWPDPK